MRSGGVVRVHAHARDGGKVQVGAYERSAPPSSGTAQAADQSEPRSGEAANEVGPPQGRLPDAKELEELPKALTIEAVRQAEPGAIRRVVLDARTRATAFMALLGTASLAQKLYWHYLNGSGAEIWFTREEARRLRPLAEAEKAVERGFIETTLRGETKDGAVADFLKALPDGRSVPLPMLRSGIPIAGKTYDVFDFNQGTRYGRTAVGDAVRAFGDYLAVGQTSVTGGLIRGIVRREGDTIFLEGITRFGLNDRFDFRQGQPGGWENVMLERYAGARSFDMRAQWDRKLVATIEMSRDRSNRLSYTPREVTWTDAN